MTPGVSVVIPTLNAERYLDECLQALRDQDYPRDRVEVLMDDPLAHAVVSRDL